MMYEYVNVRAVVETMDRDLYRVSAPDPYKSGESSTGTDTWDRRAD